MLTALLPLFFAMPVEIDGLGFDPQIIGYFLGVHGVGTALFNVLCFVKIVRRFGVKWTFFGAISLFLPLFVLMPIMNLCARTWGIGKLVWTLVFVELLLMVLRNVAFGGFFLGCQISIGIFIMPFCLRLHIHVYYCSCTEQTITWSDEWSISDGGFNLPCDWAGFVDFIVFVLGAA
jgi:hypothetical protein